MYIDFSKLTRDAYGNLERPTLILKRPHGDIMGVLQNAFNLQLELKYSEPSIATFDYPHHDGQILMPFYDDLVKDKIVEIIPYGVFIIENYQEVSDGVQTYRTVTLQSREYELNTKHIVFGEGVYNLWNPAASNDTILSYVLECAPGWSIGSVSPSLIGRYRTFSGIDTNVLDFLMNEVQDSYGCLVIFDSFARTINVVDAESEAATLPIYLSYQNLVKEGTIKQLGDPVLTKMYVEGADGISIRDVNPTGDNYLYNIDWYIENGDIPEELATKWRTWQNMIFANQQAYAAKVAARNNKNSLKLAEQTKLVELQNDRAVQENLRVVNLQALVMIDTSIESGQSLYDDMQETLQNIEDEIDRIDQDIEAAQKIITSHESAIKNIDTETTAINDTLRITSYFTDDELTILNHYFKEGSFQDTTFAVFDYDVSGSDSYIEMDSAKLAMSDIAMTAVESSDGYFVGRIQSGALTLTGDDEESIEASIVSGTIELTQTGTTSTAVVSFYLSPTYVGSDSYGSSSMTITGTTESIDSILGQLTKEEAIEYSADQSLSRYVYNYSGTTAATITSADVCITKSVSEYQQYCVQQELYDYASAYLDEQSRPLCEFELQSVDLIHAHGFDVFRNNLQLGGACYLALRDDLFLKPILLEIHLSAEDPTDFSIVFSNAFRRPRDVERLADTIRDVSTASRQFDSNKYAYGDSTNTTTWVKQLLSGGYDAALAQINAGKNNLVTIDGAGIKVDSEDGVDLIHINNGMIAMLDKRSNTVKMAMGHFMTPSGEDYVGVMADIIAGTLLAGQNLVIECPNPNGGVMQFKVDSSGVVVNNGRWYMKSDQGCIAMDPNYGFMAGTSELFDSTDEGNILPVCVQSNGTLSLDDDGFPKNTNVWIGIDGQIYLRGTVYATDGVFNGVVQATDFLDYKGNSMMTAAGKINSGYLDLMGLEIKNSAGEVVLAINEDGIQFMSAGSDDTSSSVDVDALADRVSDVEDTVDGWTYRSSTYINGNMIKTGTVMASSLQGGEVLLLDSDEDEAGYITIEDSSSSDYAIRLASGGALALIANGGNIYIESVGKFIGIDGVDTDHVTTNTHIRPTASNSYDLGTSSFLWNDVFATNCPASASDAAKKQDISYDMSAMESFYNSLQPATYKFIDGQSGRTHVGYIAQDVEMAIANSGLSSSDFAGFIKSPRDDGEGYDYALRYSEFIALNTWQIQQLKARIAELEAKLETLT